MHNLVIYITNLFKIILKLIFIFSEKLAHVEIIREFIFRKKLYRVALCILKSIFFQFF